MVTPPAVAIARESPSPPPSSTSMRTVDRAVEARVELLGTPPPLTVAAEEEGEVPGRRRRPSDSSSP